MEGKQKTQVIFSIIPFGATEDRKPIEKINETKIIFFDKYS